VLHALALRARVIIAVAFQEIDRAPHAEAGAESHHKGLQSRNRGVEKCHRNIAGIIKLLLVVTQSQNYTASQGPFVPAISFPYNNKIRCNLALASPGRGPDGVAAVFHRDTFFLFGNKK